MTNFLKSQVNRLLDFRIPEIDEKYRPAFSFWVLLMAVFLPVTTLGTLPFGEYTGPGLGEPLNYQPFWNVIESHLYSQNLYTKVLSWIFIGYIPLLVLAHITIQYLGYSRFRHEDGTRYSLKQIAVFSGTNIVATGLLIGSIILGALLLTFFDIDGLGMSFWEALTFPTQMYYWTYQFVDSNVPTIVELPYPFPLMIIILAFSFLHYWFHRLSHEFRLPWLLLHRNHHITKHLMVATVNPVFQAFPLFVFIIIPYHIALGASTKLFSSDPMLLELLVFRLFAVSMSIFNHQEAFYDFAYKNKFIKFWSMLGSNGVYHHQHHDSDVHHKCNIGGQHSFAMIWDRVFGTFVEPPAKAAPCGLIGMPEIYPNPLRLTIAGYLQIFYELKNNKNWLTRFKIVFGSINYMPEKTYDYATIKREKVAEENTLNSMTFNNPSSYKPSNA
ncbi:MAG: sterol desaturase family protein [Pseudomonadales bacterium]|nr:sterol desaturase family protein [Pseudomonadales bacterium]